jgi:hypothetical protein
LILAKQFTEQVTNPYLDTLRFVTTALGHHFWGWRAIANLLSNLNRSANLG